MRALVVDDSKVARSMLKRVLIEIGFEVFEAGDGKEALARLQEMGRADLALVDINMPVMNGTDFVRAVRALPGHAAMRVMMVTAESESTQVQEALSAGANEYVMKPYTKDALLSKLNVMGILPQS